MQSPEPFITQLNITMHNMNHNLKCWSQWCLQMGWCDYLLLLNKFNETTSLLVTCPRILRLPPSTHFLWHSFCVFSKYASSTVLASCLCHVRMLQGTRVTRAYHVYWDEVRNHWQARVQVQAQSQIEKGKRNLDSGLSLKSQGLVSVDSSLVQIIFSLLKIYNLNKWLDKTFVSKQSIIL